MEPFGLDFGPPGEVNTLIFAATVVKNQGFRLFEKASEKEAQKAPQGGPREAKMPPRIAPGGPRSGPRGPKTAPRGAKSAPRAPQEPPKRFKKGAKRISIFGWALEVAPGGLREPFSSDFGNFLEPFWLDFRSFFP